MEHNAKILLADDSHAIRFLVSEILTSAGFTVVEAENGQEAIEKTYKENPDLLILDYEMPYKNGFEVVQVATAQEAKAYLLSAISAEASVDTGGSMT
ncbi:MAG: response regulator, partial [Elusimicrobiaceae bacterium]|nr:response regulator [Elusimicrobiaceae bacterium]